MRLRPALLAAVLTAAPAAARAQAAPPAFTEVFSTAALAGCARESRPGDVAPCLTGTASFGRLTATTFGVRFDLATDWSSYGGPLPLLGAFLAGESEFFYSTAGVSSGDCLSVAGRLDGDRCTQLVESFGTSFNAGNVLSGQTATYVRAFAATGPDRVAGAPSTFRFELVDLIYEVRDGQGSSTRRVQPAIAVATVPEPSTLALGGVGAVALAAATARRRRQGGA